MLDPREAALLAAAERRDGVFSRREAFAAGLTPGQVDWRLRSGQWRLLQPATYCRTGVPVTPRTRLRAAIASVRETDSMHQPRIVAASYQSAATLLGLERVPAPPDPEITVTGMARFRLSDVVVHRSRDLPRCDVRVLDGMPVTSGARTLVDLATAMDPTDAVALLDDVIGARLAARAWVHRRTTELQAGRRNCAYLRRLTAPGAEGEFRSWLERTSARTFRWGGLPAPAWNVPIKLGARTIAVADALFAPWRVIAELDGLRFHESAERRAQDRNRDRLLAIEGYVVLRFSYWEVVREPEKVVETIRRALDRRARRVTGKGPAPAA